MPAKNVFIKLACVFFVITSLTLSSVDAQSTQPVLRWVTAEGKVASYVPATQTLREFQLPFEITTLEVHWLPDHRYFVHQLDDIQIVDAQSGDVTCSLTAESVETWDLSPTQAESLLLYQTGDSHHTVIVHLNWHTCEQDLLASIDGEFVAAAPAPHEPFIALSTAHDGDTKVHVIDLSTGSVNTIDVPSQDVTVLYWTQNSEHLIVGSAAENYVVTPATSTIERLDDISGSVWAVPDAPLLLRKDLFKGLPTQFWGFVDGQIGELLFEIEGEAYDHMPGFSPDFRYYVYTAESTAGAVLVYDWQTSEVTEIDVSDALRRWSPDSRWLALFQSDPQQIYLYDMQTGVQQSYNGSIFWFEGELWSHNNQQIAFWQRDEHQEHLILGDITDGSTDRLYSRPALEGFTSAAFWSPDDAYLLIKSVEIRANETMTTCHNIVEVETGNVDSLGCGDWSFKWDILEDEEPAR